MSSWGKGKGRGQGHAPFLKELLPEVEHITCTYNPLAGYRSHSHTSLLGRFGNVVIILDSCAHLNTESFICIKEGKDGFGRTTSYV